jgi:hypothetical protein
MARCLICSAAALKEVEPYRKLPRVSSDARPWPAGGRLTVCSECGTVQKLLDSRWKSEIERIYNEYEIYHQADGFEQLTYSPTAAEPRSIKLIMHLLERLDLPERGSILDFGCGNGATLRNFAVVRPGWKLYGSEIAADDLPRLSQIPGFMELFTCAPDQIPGQYSLVTLIHALEHLTDPITTLIQLRERAGTAGYLFIQTPDLESNPYDLIVADHLLHFTSESLRFTLDRAGYEPMSLTNQVISKELSLISRVHETVKQAAPLSAETSFDLVQRHLDFLQTQITTAERVARSSPHFGIFGTSNAGTWLAGILGNDVLFFVDEDPKRINRTHMGLPILAPSDIPAGANVFVPLVPEVAASVARRLASPKVRFHLPLAP